MMLSNLMRRGALACCAAAFAMICCALPNGVRAQEAERLSANVNSTASELIPRISPDGRRLYFVREGHPKNTGIAGKDQDVWFCRRNPDSSWAAAVNIGPPLNNRGPNSLLSISPDGSRALVMHEYGKKDELTPGVSISEKNAAGEWAKPEPLKIKNLINSSRMASYFLANDGRTLLLELQGRGTHGRQDLYVSFLGEEGEWSEPMNLGPGVNTYDHEFSPFLASDNRTMYFASAGRKGYGKSDIFMSRRLDSTWRNWSPPRNLGPQINTPGIDAYFSLPASGDYAYFTSTENAIGQHDIFRILLPDSLRPQPVVLVRGKAIDVVTGKPMQAEIYYERLSDGVTVGSGRTDPETGEYQIALPAGAHYGLYARTDQDYAAISDRLDLTDLLNYEEKEVNVELAPLKVGQIIRLNNLFFQIGKANLKPESYAELERMVEMLEKYPTLVIEVSGHTDATGSQAINQKLSLQRAEDVRNYLLDRGVAPERVVPKGYGAERPLYDNNNSEESYKNRRVEFEVLEI